VRFSFSCLFEMPRTRGSLVPGIPWPYTCFRHLGPLIAYVIPSFGTYRSCLRI